MTDAKVWTAYITELVLAAVRENWPTTSGLIQEWHPDDQKLARDYSRSRWDSFDQRREMILAQRQDRLAVAVLSALSGHLDSDTMPVPEMECPACGAKIRARMGATDD